MCTVRRAFSLLYKGKAKVIWLDGGKMDTYGFENWLTVPGDGECLGTISNRIRVPRVIVLIFFDLYPVKTVKFTRRNIYERDNYTCQYCGRKLDRQQLNIDHISPLSRKGKTVWENVVCSCLNCNVHKSNRTLEEASMKLIRKPVKPKWNFYLRRKVNDILQEYGEYLHL